MFCLIRKYDKVGGNDMKNIKELIKEFCEYEDFEYSENYSGREMYGRKCVTITCFV